MKSKSKKHITGNRAARKNSVRPIILSVASALSLASAQAAYASFAATPLSLQNKTETSGQLAVKHNIMFFIDDSGSMAFNVDGTKTTAVPLAEQRLTIAKNALNSVLDKYQGQFNWGLQTLHNNGGSDTPDFSTSWSEMKNKVNKITARNVTPTTRRYYEIVSNVVMPNVKYRCQKSYVVLMSMVMRILVVNAGDLLIAEPRTLIILVGINLINILVMREEREQVNAITFQESHIMIFGIGIIAQKLG